MPSAVAAVATSAAAALALGLLAAAAPAQAAGPAKAGPAAIEQLVAGTGHGFKRFNVADTHSPQVERMLAGGIARSPKAARTAGSSAPTVQGVDISSMQHPDGAAIDWQTVAQAGYKFAFIKVSEGSYYVNPYYASDSRHAQAAGMLTAPFIFAIPNYSSGTLQADYGIDGSGYTPDGKVLTPILDIEYDPYYLEDGTNACYGMTAAQLVSWIKAFVAEMVRRTGRAPVIYTTQDWWDTCTGDSTAFAADPLWIASYGPSVPTMPAAWQNWTYWQYSSTATVPGISSTVPVDVDYMNPAALALAETATQSDAEGSAPHSVTARTLDGSATTPPTFAATGLPAGMSIDAATGVISGTLPAQTGTFPVKISATAGTARASHAFTWYVHGPISLGALAGQAGSVGAPALMQAAAADGLPGCTLSFSASGLPAGLSISSCGLISGWLRRSGRYTVTVRVADSAGTGTQRTFSWQVAEASRSGPAGQIRLGWDGKCLTSLSKTEIVVETCAAATARAGQAQQWTVAANGSIRLGYLCLTARPVTGSGPAALALASCATGGERWQIGTNAVLVNLADGRCLTDKAAKNGALADAVTCYAVPNNTGSASTPAKSQVWTMPAGPLTSGIAGYCAGDQHPPGTKLGPVILRGCGAAVAAWTVGAGGAITAGGECLSLNAGKTSRGTSARLVGCRSSAGQVWQLSGGPIGVELLNPLSGLCLADPGDVARAGNTLAMQPCVASDPGVWWRVS